MKLGLITDIHEKVDLLRSALDDLKRERVDQIVAIGDVFETGERIQVTCELLADAQVVGVWGNHDFGLCDDPPQTLIYHPIEAPANAVSPIDATITEMVSSRPIKVACPYLGQIPLQRIVDKCADWQSVTDVEELLRSQGRSDREWFVDFLI